MASPQTVTTARCLSGCGTLAEGDWAETDKAAVRHTEKPPKHATECETRALPGETAAAR